jgi:uncharacterized protein YndB with AHSA1/START domain
MDQVSIWINASPEQVWPLVSDVTRYGEWSPENKGARWLDHTRRPAVGAKFIGANQHGLLRWKTHCTVIEYQDNYRFAFAVDESRVQWTYQVEAEGDGTRLTEWREKVAVIPLPFRMLESTGLLGRPRDAWVVDGMRQTLEAIKRAVEQARDEARPGTPRQSA